MAEEQKQETWQEREERLKKEFKKYTLPEFFKVMKDKDIEYFSIDFNGCGDSGDFEDIYFVDEKDVPNNAELRDEAGIDPEKNMFNMSDPEDRKLQNKVTALRDYYLDPLGHGKQHIWTRRMYDNGIKPESKYISIQEYIIEVVDQYLNAESIDWYNNEGGHGTATFEDGVLEIDGGTYYYEENGFNFHFDSKDYKEKANG